MPTTTATDGTTLHYRVLGDGPRSVVLVHGWMMSGAVWDAMLEKLDMTGLRLVVPDHRGTGESGRPASGYSLEQYAKDVLAVADHAGAKRFSLVGHSMGGQIAQWVACGGPRARHGPGADDLGARGGAAAASGRGGPVPHVRGGPGQADRPS